MRSNLLIFDDSDLGFSANLDFRNVHLFDVQWQLRMEQFLNFAWLAISIALAVLLLASRRARGTSSISTVWLTYLVLIAMLLPVISMTDDLMAMVAPTDGEQIARRYEVAPNAPQHHPAPHFAIFHPIPKFSCPMNFSGWLEASPLTCEFLSPAYFRVSDRAPPMNA